MTRPRHHADDVADALIQAAVKNPFDRRPRLVLADLYDELGEPARAEFIRIQCDRADTVGREKELAAGADWFWPFLARTDSPDVSAVTLAGEPWVWQTVWGAVRNGMVEEVAAQMEWLIGADCEECLGVDGIGLDFRTDCRHCGGTGRTPGHLADVVARHPVTKVVTDREPWHDRRIEGSTYSWFDADYYGKPQSVLPPPVYAAVLRLLGITDEPSQIEFSTPQDAKEALSRALVDLGRERAGLPNITDVMARQAPAWVLPGGDDAKAAVRAAAGEQLFHPEDAAE